MKKLKDDIDQFMVGFREHMAGVKAKLKADEDKRKEYAASCRGQAFSHYEFARCTNCSGGMVAKQVLDGPSYDALCPVCSGSQVMRKAVYKGDSDGTE